MTEQDQTPVKIKNFDAVWHDAFIRECAHEVMVANASSQETIKVHLSDVRQKLAQVNPKKSGMFSTSYLRKLAEKRRLLAANKMQCEVA